jgi:hypothetical protein
MRVIGGVLLLCFLMPSAVAQVIPVDPQIVTETNLEGKVAVLELAPRFVTTVRLPEAVNSVVVGDPSQFQVEHSDREPKLVFVKAISTKAAETNLLISMANGREISLLLVSRGERPLGDPDRVDFLFRYEAARGFSVAPSGFPSTLVGETVPLAQPEQVLATPTRTASALKRSPSLVSAIAIYRPATGSDSSGEDIQTEGLDNLLEQQESAPLPVLYGEHIAEEPVSGDRVRAGVSRVIDGGQQVIVLFSVVNPRKHAILLMPPQVQLGGRTTSGKLIRHTKWSTAEQLPVMNFRLSKRRIGPGERADGVMLFERPPYKQSNETLLLQVAESGAVDRPALAPIGFGISTVSEDGNGRR